MSKLQKLIQELCPYGVEYKPLGDKDVSIMQRGTSLTKKDSIEGIYPVISGGKVPAFYCNQFNREGETITVAGSGAGAGYVQYWNEPIFVCDAFSIKGIGDVSTKYLYYCLTNLQEKIYATKKGGGVPHVHIASIEKFLVPIPPPQVQKEIIHILDDFTNLAAELQAELQARKEQYEYYRNKLLTFDKIGGGTQSVTWVKMSEICKIYTGGEPPKDAIKGNYKDSMHPYPIWGNGKEVYGYASSYKIDKDATVISSIGANAGTVYFRKAYFTPIIRLKVLIPKNDNILSKFLYFYLSTVSLAVKSSSVPNMNANDVKKLLIPIPSLAEQQRIVSILDKFEALVNDLTEGLPAEIAAVQEQYEYYRNKLLSFPRTKISA